MPRSEIIKKLVKRKWRESKDAPETEIETEKEYPRKETEAIKVVAGHHFTWCEPISLYQTPFCTRFAHIKFLNHFLSSVSVWVQWVRRPSLCQTPIFACVLHAYEMI
jgi:hypothetical protein